MSTINNSKQKDNKITSIVIEEGIAIIAASENGIIFVHSLVSDFDDLYLNLKHHLQISKIWVKDNFIASNIQLIFGTFDEQIGICTKGWFNESNYVFAKGKLQFSSSFTIQVKKKIQLLTLNTVMALWHGQQECALS